MTSLQSDTQSLPNSKIRPNIYLQTKNFHRFTMWIVLILGLFMSTTGFFMKFSELSVTLGIRVGVMREIHNFVSVYFSLVFFGMATSGLLLYFYPIWTKRKQK